MREIAFFLHAAKQDGSHHAAPTYKTNSIQFHDTGDLDKHTIE